MSRLIINCLDNDLLYSLGRCYLGVSPLFRSTFWLVGDHDLHSPASSKIFDGDQTVQGGKEKAGVLAGLDQAPGNMIISCWINVSINH